MGITFRTRSLLTLAFIGFFAYVAYETWNMELQARLFPLGVSFVALAFLLGLLISEMRPSGRADDNDTGMDLAFSEEESSVEGRWRTAEMFAWIYGFAAMLYLLGFFIAIPLTVFLYLVRQREKLALILLLPLATGLSVWWLFDYLITVPFPPGAIFEWLGWI
ncbi:MAG: hypothetical protein RLZ98_1016 [Pseudomonadota bacterium]|jgi:hypothetical protein